jgi:signal transduction histidine kinase
LRHEVSLWSPLWWNDAQRGVLALGPRLADDPFDEADLRQLAVLSGVLALALNGQELVHSLSERATTLVTLTHRLSEAHEQERAHLSRELHDVVAQDLIALTRQLRRYGAENVPPPDIWADMLTAAQDALTATRRICNGLRPAILDLGLLPALRDLVAEAGEREGAPELSLVVEGEEQRLPAELEFALFRVAQEGVNNAVKHSGARQVRLEICFDDALRLRVRDDGQGFAVPRGPRDVPGDHLGLIGMRERLAQFGGTITITSAPGQGAVLDARVPLNR